VTKLGPTLQRLRERKVVQWALAYLAGAWVLLQAITLLGATYGWPGGVMRSVPVLLGVGFLATLVLSWYHGEKGQQRVSIAELVLLVALVVFAGGAVTWAVRGGGAMAGPTGTIPSHAAAGASRAIDERSIAVLPFENLSGDPGHEYFSDGITEDILIHLSHIADLKVIARTSALRYKGSEKSAREIGQDLAVATILVGSVRRAGDQVRVSARLIHADTEQQLWAESYDRRLTDIFQLQAEIAQQIARALDQRLSPEQRERMAAAPTGNLTAWDYYLRARALQLTRPDLDRAIAFFRQAIALDPDYALAHAGLGAAFAKLEGYHGAGRHWLDSAQVAAQHAIALDPRAADGHAALAFAYWNSGRTAEAAETYARALALRPNDPEALWGLSFTRWRQGELAEAVRLAKRAAELDPASPTYSALVGRCYLALGDFAAAEAWFRRALQLQPDFPWAHQDLLWLYIWQGDRAVAAEQLRTTRALLPASREFLDNAARLALVQGDHRAARSLHDQLLQAHPELSWVSFAEIGFVYAQIGDRARAEQMWQRGIARATAMLDEGRQLSLWFHNDLIRSHAARGDREAALRSLDAALADGWRAFPIIDLAADPLLESLHGDRRFEEIRGRILTDLARMRRQVEREDP
jgi:TolB-like protein/Tfp pilus assembly protein PilF